MEQTHTIDLSPLLNDLNQQIEEAEQEQRAILLKTTRLRGLRDGVLLAVEHAQKQAPVVTTGAVEGG